MSQCVPAAEFQNDRPRVSRHRSQAKERFSTNAWIGLNALQDHVHFYVSNVRMQYQADLSPEGRTSAYRASASAPDSSPGPKGFVNQDKQLAHKSRSGVDQHSANFCQIQDMYPRDVQNRWRMGSRCSPS